VTWWRLAWVAMHVGPVVAAALWFAVPLVRESRRRTRELAELRAWGQSPSDNPAPAAAPHVSRAP
jgi:hypothetical protein